MKLMSKDEYEDVLDQILYYFNPCYKEQLVLALHKCFNRLTKDEIYDILNDYQYKGKVLFSSDGWAMTKGKYEQLTNDTKNESIDVNAYDRLNYMNYIIQNYCDLRVVESLWIMIYFLPYSLDFSVLNKPFQISFMSKDKLMQVIKINAKDEDRKIELLKSLPKPTEYKDKETGDIITLKKSIVRVCILENSGHAWKIPQGIGVKYICEMDNKETYKFKIVEKRKESEVW